MSERLHVATPKGLFTIERDPCEPNGWRIADASFLGDNRPMLLADPRDGTIYCAFDHGHFGAKLKRSRDRGRTWEDTAVPAYPPKPDGDEPTTNPMQGREPDWSLKLIWSLEAGGTDEPGVLWLGTIPGGLFKSTDGGESWELNRPLWHEPKRAR